MGDHHAQRIVLWGGNSAGKSWYLASLARSLIGLSSSFLNRFEVDLYDQTQAKPLLIRSPSEIAASPSFDHVWKFEWGCKHPRIAECMHIHQILVSDLVGEDCFNTVSLLPADQARITLLNSNLALFFMDAGEESEERVELMLRMLDNFITALSQDTSEKKFIAFCISKIDLLSAKMINKQPKELMSFLFGKRVFDFASSVGKSRNIVTEVFPMSSAGFLRGRKRNFSFDTNNLIDADNWNPYKVLAPFFWFLNQRETDSLSQVGSILSRYLFVKKRLNTHRVNALTNLDLSIIP